MYLEKIKGPADLKKLDAEDRKVLIAEMRKALLERASVHGGHVGPDLGFVEAAVALHTVFDSPKDKIREPLRTTGDSLLLYRFSLKNCSILSKGMTSILS